MPDRTVRALTVQQPWAWAITVEKRIENRSWSTSYRGPLLIHAARAHDPAGFADWRIRDLAHSEAVAGAVRLPGPTVESRTERLLHPNGHVRGAIIAVAQLVEVHADRGHFCRLLCGGWAEPSLPDGPIFHWVLDDVRPTTPVMCRGALGLWRPPLEVLEQLGDLGSPTPPAGDLL